MCFFTRNNYKNEFRYNLHMSKYVPFLVCLLKVLHLTSEHDTDFHADNSKEIFLEIFILLLLRYSKKLKAQ